MLFTAKPVLQLAFYFLIYSMSIHGESTDKVLYQNLALPLAWLLIESLFFTEASRAGTFTVYIILSTTVSQAPLSSLLYNIQHHFYFPSSPFACLKKSFLNLLYSQIHLIQYKTRSFPLDYKGLHTPHPRYFLVFFCASLLFTTCIPPHPSSKSCMPSDRLFQVTVHAASLLLT